MGETIYILPATKPKLLGIIEELEKAYIRMDYLRMDYRNTALEFANELKCLGNECGGSEGGFAQLLSSCGMKQIQKNVWVVLSRMVLQA